MAYIGNSPAEAYISISSQTFTTINGTGYTLSSSVTNSEDIALFLNNVRQKPSTYTATGTALTMGTATTTADALYCVYLGKALQTVSPGSASVGTAQIADDAVTYAKIQDTTTANRVIGAATAGVVSEVQVVDDMTNFVSTASAPGLTVRGDGTTDGYLQLNCDQNSHGVKIKSPAHSAAQSYTLTLPGAAPAINKFIETDGSGNLSFSSVDVTTDITGTVPTANLGTGTADSTTFLRGDQTYATPADNGKILQAVSATDTTDRSSTSTTFVTGSNTLTVDITPSADTSKIFVMVSTTLYQYTGNKGGYLTIYRDVTNLGNAQGLIRILDQDSSSGFSGAGTCIVLDSPATTSAITYQAYIKTDSGGTIAMNSNTSGFITAFEVGA